MNTIWKFPLTPGRQVIDMPAGAKLLTAQMQDQEPVLWALVDPTQAKGPAVIHVVGTGQQAPEDGRYIATFQMGWMVWHVFAA